MNKWSVFVGLIACAAMSGCLASTYTISHEELTRMAQLPASERGREVRVTQEITLAHGDHPRAMDPDGQPQQAAVYSRGTTIAARSYRAAGFLAYGALEGLGRGGGGGGGQGYALMALVVVAMECGAAAIVAGTALASVLSIGISEMARFDGWVELPENQQLQLMVHGQPQLNVPLDGLDPSQLTPRTEARIDGSFRWIRRASLNRHGMFGTHALVLGGLGPSSIAGGITGSFGWNPNNWVSFALAAQLIGTPTATGSTWRFDVGPEIVLWPLRWVGVYSSVLASVSNPGAFGGRAGIAAEIPLRSRAAVQLRVGAHATPGTLSVEPESSIGIALY